MSPAVHLCPSNTTWLLAVYLSSPSSSSSSLLSLSVCSPLLNLRQWALLKGSYWTGAQLPSKLQPSSSPLRQPAVWLGNYPRIDSPNRDHFFTSCRITKRLIISPAHLHSFQANVSASQSLYWLVDGDARNVLEVGREPFTVKIWLFKGQVLFSSHLRWYMCGDGDFSQRHQWKVSFGLKQFWTFCPVAHHSLMMLGTHCPPRH